MSGLENNEITFTVYDKDGAYVEKYTLLSRIAKEKAKFFNNNFGQSEYDYNGELDKNTLIMIFDSLFFNVKKIEPQGLDEFIKVYQLLDYLMVPNICDLLIMKSETFETFKDFDSLVNFAKSIPIIFKKYASFISKTPFDCYDILICTCEIQNLSIGDSERLIRRYIENIDSPHFIKHLSLENRTIIEKYICEKDRCFIIFEAINYRNAHYFTNILKHCAHDDRCYHFYGEYSEIKNKIYELLNNRELFKDVYVILDAMLSHSNYHNKLYIFADIHKYFKGGEMKFYELFEKHMSNCDGKKERMSEKEKKPVVSVWRGFGQKRF